MGFSNKVRIVKTEDGDKNMNKVKLISDLHRLESKAIFGVPVPPVPVPVAAVGVAVPLTDAD